MILKKLLSERTATLLVILLNIIFAIVGAISIVHGLILSSSKSSYLTFLSDRYLNTNSLHVVTGLVVLATALSGLFAAWSILNKVKTRIIIVYVGLVFFLSIYLFVTGNVALTLRYEVSEKMIRRNMDAALHKYSMTGGESYFGSWNYIQRDLSCCGITHFSDWDKVHLEGNLTFPTSCNCQLPKNCTEGGAFRPGCLKLVRDRVVHDDGAAGGSLIALSFGELLTFAIYCLGGLPSLSE